MSHGKGENAVTQSACGLDGEHPLAELLEDGLEWDQIADRLDFCRLLLDELPELGARNLETLRQPLQDRVITISRASGSLTFPANFVLVAAMNPCPCGHYALL